MTMKRHLRRWSRRLGTAVTSVALLAMGIPLPAGAVAYTLTFDADTTLTVNSINLTILSGSTAESVTVNNDNTFTAVLISGETLTVKYPGPSAGNLANDGGLAACTYSSGDNVLTVTGPKTIVVTPTTSPTCSAPSGGGGGGGSSYSAIRATVISPNGGESYEAGSTQTASWSASGTDFAAADLLLSTDGGATFLTLAHDLYYSYFVWKVPTIATTDAIVKVVAKDRYGTSKATDTSDASFIITVPSGSLSSASGTDATTAEIPEIDPTASGAYSPSVATTSTPTIDVDKGLAIPDDDTPPPCVGGTLIKGPDGPAVYYCGKDRKRYVFPNERIFYSWFADFSSLTELTAAQLAAVPLGGNVSYRPGVRMIKIQSDPKVYTVSRNGLLRWVTSEAVAKALYGADWNTKIDDVDAAFFFTYQVGDPIGAACPADDADLDVTNPCFSEDSSNGFATKG